MSYLEILAKNDSHHYNTGYSSWEYYHLLIMEKDNEEAQSPSH
jgi:hypothetical protein